MSVMLQKPPAYLNVYNDLSDLVVNFFRVLRDQPDDLIRAIKLTPYARSEYLLSQQPSEDPLEQARRFYVWCWQGRGRGGVNKSGGWRFMKSNTRGQTTLDDWNKTDYLYATASFIQQNIQIEHGDALTIIRRYDTPKTLFYIDPPYVHTTRGERWSESAYTHEMTDDDHRALAAKLHSVKGMVILSGYPGDLYNDLYAHWRTVHRHAYAERNKTTTEILWMNFAPPLRLF